MIQSLSEITQLWNKVLQIIDKKISEPKFYESFFQDTYIHDINGDTISVVVNSTLAATLMQTKYYSIISDAVTEVTNSSYKIIFITVSEIDKTNITSIHKEKPTFFDGIQINPNMNFDNFVVGDFNREASQGSLLIARNPGKMFNPLYIHSHSGLGKTHLLHAIGNYVVKEGNPSSKILYITANDFVEAYIKSVRGEKDADALKEYVSSFDILLLDDVQFLADKVKTQETFFYIYEKMIYNGKQIVITSDKHPNELKNLEERLVTRFNQGLVVTINDPDKNSCVSILEKKIESSGLDISKFDNEVLEFFADKFSKNVRELEGALNRLIFHVINLHNADHITLDVAADAVSSLIGGKNITTQINEQKIINIVADYYQLSPSQLTGKTRTGKIALARHIAMYLIRQNLDVPLKKIGEIFGGKDHTTIINGIKHVDKELKTNPQLKQVLDILQKQIKK